MNIKRQCLLAMLVFLGLCLPLTSVHAVDCTTQKTGPIELGFTCAFAGNYDGAVEGNIIVESGVTLTVRANQIINVNEGYNYTITAEGAGIVIIDDGAIQISDSIICLVDADGDTYPDSFDAGTQTFATGSCGTGKIARKDAMTQADCNDGNASYFAALTCYADADGDGVYSKTSGSVCGGATCAGVGQSANAGTDCCDTDANAKPGQTSWFAVARTGCGGFDYNCDSVETHAVTGGSGGCGTCTNNTSTQSCSWSGVSSGWTSADPGCGNTATTRQAGMCNEMLNYPNCAITGCATFSTTQTCR